MATSREPIAVTCRGAGRALHRFHARYLDNIKVDPATADFADAAVVAAALMHRGNAEAYELGRQIRSLVPSLLGFQYLQFRGP